MKKKTSIIISILILAFIGLSTYMYLSKPDGKTIESREQLLKDMPKGSDWKISLEQEIGDYIVSGVYSSDGKSGIAVFEPIGNGKYKLSSRAWRDNSRIVISGYVFNGTWYDIVWFNGANTEYAEITYTIDGVEQNPIRHETTNMEIFIKAAPAKEYSINVVYYDAEGNIYE